MKGAGIINKDGLISDKDWANYLDSLNFKGSKKDLKDKLVQAVKIRVPNEKFGIAFSGGIDSSLIALICKNLKKDFICYSVGIEGSSDLKAAHYAAKKHGFKLKEKVLSFKEAEKYIKKANLILGDIERNVVHVGVGAVFLAVLDMMKKDKVKYLFSGLGSEEIFAGYERHNVKDINKECLFGLKRMVYGDFLRDYLIGKNNVLVPFLDKEVIECAMNINGSEKIKKGYKKYVLREIALDYGLDEKIVWRKKKAAQYGSKIDKVLSKLSGKMHKDKYLYSLFNAGVLFSSGKDSCYSLYLMKKKGVNIKCLISLLPNNPDSYMFHKESKKNILKQSKAIGLPVVFEETKGLKEKELKELEKALVKSKEKFKINSVITGALYSNYQASRINTICKKLGLTVFNPLWHFNQEQYMKDLLDTGFKFKFVKVAADGLDNSWVGKIIDSKALDKLIKLSKKFKFNVAGEGGEFESFVIDGPIFNEKLT